MSRAVEPNLGPQQFQNLQFKKNGRPFFSNNRSAQPLEYIQFEIATKHLFFQRCAELYKQGHSLRDIAIELQRSKTSVRQALLTCGISLRSIQSPLPTTRKKSQPIRIGIPPYGFAWIRGRLVLDPKEMEIVRLMFELRSRGLTYRDIAEKLNAAGKRTRSRTPWEHTVIRRAILRLQQEKARFSEFITLESGSPI